MQLTSQDKELIAIAQSYVNPQKILWWTIGEAGSALITENGKIFHGISIHTTCWIGFCAEHSAIAQMLTEVWETHIKTIVATQYYWVSSPCGRCRELINLLDPKNVNTEIIVSGDEKVRLYDLLPYNRKANLQAKKIL